MPRKPARSPEVHSLTELMSPAALKLLAASGGDFVRQIGMDVVRGVVLDVLTGWNLRDSVDIKPSRIQAFLRRKLDRAPLESFIGLNG